MNFSEIVDKVGGRWISQIEDAQISQILLDSRQTLATDNLLFIAIKGPNHNAHDHIKELIDKGVKHFILEEDIEISAEINVCRVERSIEALQLLGKSKREAFNSPVVGITGSNGKTIVKEWLYTITSKKLNTIKSPKSYNSQIGVPLSLWQIESKHQLALIEVGISQPDEMIIQESMVQPDIGIFTNIGSAHGENFESLQAKAFEKAQLFKNSQKVICSDSQSEVTAALQSLEKPEIITWGKSPQCHYQITRSSEGLIIKDKAGEKHEFALDIKRFIFLENICHVIVCALELGIENHLIQEGIETLNHSDLRLSIKRGSRGNYIVDDTYNNDLEGLKLALEFLDLQNLNEDRVLILSDLVQSKLTSEDVRSINRLISAKRIKQLIVVGHQFKETLKNPQIDYSYFSSTEDLLASDLIQHLEHKLILVKGSRRFEFENVVKALSEKIHKTRLEIDLNAIQHNLSVHKKLLRPSTKLMVMVKAFAYGAGSHELARILQYQKVDYLGVAFVDEGIDLRMKGITLPIMVMNATTEDAPLLMKYDLEPEVYSIDQLKAYSEHYSEQNKALSCHWILNTGMNRLGFEKEEIEGLINFIISNQHIEVKSIFTHLAAADDPAEKAFTLIQIKTFQEMAEQIKRELSITPLLHCLNSSGIVNFKEHQMDMVRLGIGLHGISSNKEIASQLRLPAQLKSVISQIRKIKKGETIGYSRAGKALNDMTIATVAIGYADGYSRAFSNGNAFMSIKGQKAAIIGNICMDMCMIDITGIEAKAEDEVIVFGTEPTIEQLAQYANTIPYEILTNVSDRVQRVFHLE